MYSLPFSKSHAARTTWLFVFVAGSGCKQIGHLRGWMVANAIHHAGFYNEVAALKLTLKYDPVFNPIAALIHLMKRCVYTASGRNRAAKREAFKRDIRF